MHQSVCIIWNASQFFCQQCNNPLTKEPKLVSAVRIIPEWTEYDEEIRQLLDDWTEGDRLENGSLASPSEEPETWLPDNGPHAHREL